MRMAPSRMVAWIVALILVTPWSAIGPEPVLAQPSGSAPVVVSPLVRDLLLRGWFPVGSGHVVRDGRELEFHSGFGAVGGSGQWVDVKTGKEEHWQVDPSDPTRAFNAGTGQNAVWDDNKQQWIDTRTGQAVSPSAVVRDAGGTHISPLVRDLLLRGWFPVGSGHVVRDGRELEFHSGFGAVGGSGQWVDVKTGKEEHWQVDPSDPTRAFNPGTGQNAAWDDNKQQWIDTRTGQAVSPSAVVQKPISASEPQNPTTQTPAPSASPTTAGQLSQPIQPGTVKQVAPTKDPATGNTTTGTTKTVSAGPGTTVTTANSKTVTPTGVEVSRYDVTVTVVKGPSGIIKTTTATFRGAGGDEETTEIEEIFDATGTQESGAKAVIKVDPQKKTRTTTIFKWDPKTKSYVQDGDPKVETIASATHPNVYLPDTASAGSVVTGTVETRVNEAAAGTVTVTAPSGDQHAIIVGAGGHFLLPAALVVAGARLTIRDELGNVIANEVLHVLSGSAGDRTSPPQIARLPDILPQGGIARITGSNLCTPTAVTQPNVLLTTSQTADAIPALSSSDREMEFRVPRTVPPGPGSLTVENGAGQTSAPRTVNPVKISITTPPRVSVGQAFDATITISGLTPENRQKTLFATVSVSGNATFAGGQREMRIPIKDGRAKVPVVAHGPGGYEVRVTGISSETP